ncbi:MAG: CRISPR-associated endonuclease Cas1 [Burkholderiales bacterium]|nr:CRISPR-associated endonuclease Cas1 [Burkholderiales bacterium]
MLDLTAYKAGALCYDPVQPRSPRLRWRSHDDPEGRVLPDPGSLVACPRWIHPTFDALAECVEHGVDLAILRGNRITALVRAQYRASTVSVRRQQYARHDDSAAAWALAYSLVEAKARNQRNLLYRAAQRRHDARLHAWAARVHAEWRSLPMHRTLERLRGGEGHLARTYFAAWPHWLRRPQFQRIARRAHDPVNLLLDICYSRLCQAVTLELLAAGYDIALGTLHAEDPFRPTLALDLMEPLRPLVVDRFVLAIVPRVQESSWFQCSDGRWQMTAVGHAALRTRWLRWWHGTARKPGVGSTAAAVVATYRSWVETGSTDLTWPTVAL